MWEWIRFFAYTPTLRFLYLKVDPCDLNIYSYIHIVFFLILIPSISLNSHIDENGQALLDLNVECHFCPYFYPFLGCLQKSRSPTFGLSKTFLLHLFRLFSSSLSSSLTWSFLFIPLHVIQRSFVSKLLTIGDILLSRELDFIFFIRK